MCVNLHSKSLHPQAVQQSSVEQMTCTLAISIFAWFHSKGRFSPYSFANKRRSRYSAGQIRGLNSGSRLQQLMRSKYTNSSSWQLWQFFQSHAGCTEKTRFTEKRKKDLLVEQDWANLVSHKVLEFFCNNALCALMSNCVQPLAIWKDWTVLYFFLLQVCTSLCNIIIWYMSVL